MSTTYDFYKSDGHEITITASGSDIAAGAPGVLGVAKVPYVAMKLIKDGKSGPARLKGTFLLSVHGYGEAAGEAVSIGDKIYLDGSELNKDETNGDFFGVALGAVSSDATTKIDVLVGSVPSVDVT